MTPPPGSMRTGRARRRCSPPSRARFAVTFLSRYPESGRAGQIGGSRAPMTSVGLVMWDRSASSVGVERGGGGGDRVEGGLGVDRQAGQAGVPALAHQHREPDARFAPPKDMRMLSRPLAPQG